jgi:hypothetical protein
MTKELPYSGTRQVLGDKQPAPQLKKENVIMCCLVRAIKELKGMTDKYRVMVGIMISRGKPEKLKRKTCSNDFSESLQ